MSVTPKVYQFVPGAKTGAAIINGVKRVMDFPGAHHWEVVAHTNNVSIVLRDKATSLRVLRLVAVTSGTPSPTVDCYYSRDGGLTESVKCWMSGGNTTIDLADALYGMGTELAYVVEIEDCITICTAKAGAGTSGGTAIVPYSMLFGVHAGRILSAHNKSDSAGNIGEEGMLCGTLCAFTAHNWAMLSPTTGAGGGVASGSQSAIWMGSAYSAVSLAISASDTRYRDKRTAATVPLLENIGDGQTIERLAPFGVAGFSSGAFTAGHTSYTRYIRARKYGYGDTALGTVIDNLTILQSSEDPNIGWRHNFCFNNVAVTINLVHIWCPPGQEVNVP